MNILLLGEFSAVHKNLKEGLQELGHNAVVAGSGDGFKKISTDVSLDSEYPGLFGKIHKKIKPLIELRNFTDYDVVQLVNPFIFYSKYFPSGYYFERIKEQNSKFFLLAAGDDAYFWSEGRKKLKYGPFEDVIQYDSDGGGIYLESRKAFQLNNHVIDLCRGIIPIMYEYEVCYDNNPKRLNTIPIPINCNKIKYIENRIGSKLTVFHGLNRYGFKGTRHVEEAFKYLNKKYPNDLELIIDGKMPLDQYLELMSRTNVVIDQMYSHSLGVNGIYALAMGKIVMGGAEEESLKSLGVSTSPVINLKPNAESIISEIEKLLEIKNQINYLGYQSREFAVRVHGHIEIAKKYVDTWRKF